MASPDYLDPDTGDRPRDAARAALLERMTSLDLKLNRVRLLLMPVVQGLELTDEQKIRRFNLIREQMRPL